MHSIYSIFLCIINIDYLPIYDPNNNNNNINPIQAINDPPNRKIKYNTCNSL